MVGYSSSSPPYESTKKKPEWLELLLKMKFFGLCSNHRELRKSEINIYCINCNYSMCHHCLSSSPHHHNEDHKLLQIRRYVYQDVIRIHDIQKLLDCSKVQPYTVNSAKVVLLNPRRQSKPSKAAGGALCEICRRTITEPNRFCSIACKVSEGEGVAGEYEESGPLITTLTPDIEELSSPKPEASSSYLSSPAPSDSSFEDHGRWMQGALTARKKIDKRKGQPRRSHFF